jgi:hypothetical protein
MKFILLLICSGLFLAGIATASDQLTVEIFDYGIYSGNPDRSVSSTDSPTGKVLLDGTLKLEKQTAKIPAQLHTKFGFRYVLHAKTENEEVVLRLVYVFPKMFDKVSGKSFTRFETTDLAHAETRLQHVLWDFSEPHELVTGEWTLQVFRGDQKILEKKFDVIGSDEK